MAEAVDHAPLRFVERTGYAAGDLASCLYWNILSVFLLNFYTDTFGISALAAGTMMMITRSWDNFIDPLMGVVADRTKSRFGKFRPWLLWMAFPFMVVGVLAFVTPNVGPHGKLIYAYVTFSLFMLVYTMINVPYGALLGAISPSSKEREILSSYRFIGAFSGNLIVQGCLLWLVARLGGGNDKVGFPLAVGIFGTLAMCLFLYTFAATKERVKVAVERTASVGRDLADLCRNRPWIALAAVCIIFQVWVGIRGASLFFYFKYYVGNTDLFASFLVLGTLCSMAGVACTKFCINLFGGKKSAYIWLSILNAATLAPLYFARPSDLVPIYALQLLGSFVAAPLNAITWAMFADSADYSEWKFGRRATGLVLSAGTFANKQGGAIGGAIAGWLLAWYGYQANTVLSAHTLQGIRLMVSVLPAVASVLTAAAMILYNIDLNTQRRIEAELAARRAQALAV